MTRHRIAPSALAATLEDGTVVLDMRANRYYTLNETAAFIWGLLESGADDALLVQRVMEEFEVSAGEAESAVRELLATMRQRELVEPAEEA